MLRPALPVAARARRAVAGPGPRARTRGPERRTRGPERDLRLAPPHTLARCYIRTDTIQRIKGNLLYLTRLIIL